MRMTHFHKFVRLRAVLLGFSALAFAACDGDRLTNASNDAPGAAVGTQPVDAGTLAFATTGTGGIPFGFFHMPDSEYGAIYDGALRGLAAGSIISELEIARKAGARVMISLVGADVQYKNADGTFSLTKWKGRLGPFKGINLAPYVADGTIIGHYLIDEPNDPTNWAGTLVSQATLDEMAMYSKQLWPTMPTAVRASPTYLKGHPYKYLDAAWAQYHSRFGNVSTWLAKSVADAKAAGLALVVGVNTIAGGNASEGLPGFYLNTYALTASQLQAAGNTILAEPYGCAFLSWRYNEHYQARADIKAVLASLSKKANAHAARSCRGGAQASPPPVTPPPTTPPPGTPPPVTPPPVVTPPAFHLTMTKRVDATGRFITMFWSGVAGPTVNVWRNGKLIITRANSGRYTNFRHIFGPATYVYKVCKTGTSKCSNTVTAVFK